MNTIPEPPAVDETTPTVGGEPGAGAVHVMYGLYAASIILGFTSIIAVIIAHVKRGDLRGTPYESHCVWGFRTFWLSLLFFVIIGILFATMVLAPVAGILSIVAGIWYIYRIIKGWIKLFDKQPITKPTALF